MEIFSFLQKHVAKNRNFLSKDLKVKTKSKKLKTWSYESFFKKTHSIYACGLISEFLVAFH